MVSLHQVHRHPHLRGSLQLAGLSERESISFEPLLGVHIEEEEQEEEVDNSVRGRLVRLLEKVKRIREKKVEVEPEPQEDKKPSEPLIFCLSQANAISLYQHLSQKIPIHSFQQFWSSKLSLQ